MRKKLAGLFFLLTMVLCGCNVHGSDQAVRPSAVPSKVMTKTAIPVSTGRDSSEPDEPEEEDPWAYCAAVFNDEGQLRRVSDLGSEEYTRRVQITFMIQDGGKDSSYIIQRCMNANLYVCRVTESANCIEKLDFSVEPGPAMTAFCEDPDREGQTLTSAETGINSAYEWQCRDGVPVITNQIAYADDAGYDRSLWFRIPHP